MEVFYVAGGVLAAWALIVTALGITRHGFPGGRGAERGVAAISIVLVAGAIGTAIVSSANEDEEPEVAGAEERRGGETPGGEAAPAEPAPAEPGAGEATTSDLTLAAVPSGQLAFDTDELDGKAGEVRVTMENPSPVPHNVSIEGNGVEEEGDTVGKGGTSTVSAELKPGRYTFYCSVAGHREGGMEGTLVIE